MSSSSISNDPWIGKLVWFFPRDNKGLPIGNSALCGIVINRLSEDIYAIMYQGERVYTWSADMEEVEDWDEEMEGEDCSTEEP
jgi:hypothetical protein